MMLALAVAILSAVLTDAGVVEPLDGAGLVDAVTRNGTRRAFFVVMCRVKNERLLLSDFVPYYLNQGADHVVVLVDVGSQDEYPAWLASHPDATFVRELGPSKTRHHSQLWMSRLAYPALRPHVEWLAFVDVDEFVVTRASPNRTVRDELAALGAAACVSVPWLMFSHGGLVDEPASPIKELTSRLDLDRHHRHPSALRKWKDAYETVDVKTIFRMARFEGTEIHHPCARHDATQRKFGARCANRGVACVDGVTGDRRPIGSSRSTPREAELAAAKLVIHHYRFTSRRKIREKCGNGGRVSPEYAGPQCVENAVLADPAEIEDASLADRLSWPLWDGAAAKDRGRTALAARAMGRWQRDVAAACGARDHGAILGPPRRPAGAGFAAWRRAARPPELVPARNASPGASLRVLDAGLGAAAARWAHDVLCAQGVASCAANDARGPSSRGCCHAPPEARAAHAALLAWYADLERRAGSGAEANGSTWASAYDRGVSLLAAAAASGLVAAAGAPYTHFLPELLALVPDLRVAQTLGPAEEWASRHAAPRRDGARGESVACAEDVVRRFGLASYFDLRCLAADRAAASAPFVADGGIDRVHYSHCRQELRIVVVERGGDWDPATSALPALAGRYGLRRDDGTYSYRRAYARYLEDDAAACAASHHPFGEEFEPKFRAPADRGGCYVAAAVEAAWAGAGAYALSLALPEPGRSYAVNVLGGFDGCAEPSGLDAARFAADEAAWANRSAPAAPCAGYARGDAAMGPVLATFEVPADALHAAPRRGVASSRSGARTRGAGPTTTARGSSASTPARPSKTAGGRPSAPAT
ncbi:glycosyltransferase [Aureococcus anophagefferens]|nr:glycosyltransferase [Aureococcus anophagefferens]